MKITKLSETAALAFAKALILNELGGILSLIYKFSYAGGKSGPSFGISQMDICNNAHAIMCLRECGFTTDEVAHLKLVKTSIGLDMWNMKLVANQEIVDKYDRNQIRECLSWPLSLCSDIGVNFSSEESFIHCADYHNQFGMSRGGKMYKWLQSLQAPLTPEMVRDFKYTTLYGIAQKQKPLDHDDVWRRYANIAKVMGRTPEVMK